MSEEYLVIWRSDDLEIFALFASRSLRLCVRKKFSCLSALVAKAFMSAWHKKACNSSDVAYRFCSSLVNRIVP
jgi:hypothetical protein